MFIGFMLICLPSLFASDVIYSPDVTVYELLYGDLTNMENFFVFTNRTNDEPDEPENKTRRPVGELLARLEKDNEPYPMDGPDTYDLNIAREGVTNLTRRYRTSYTKKYEKREYHYDDDDFYDKVRLQHPTERRKKGMLIMINLQFLIHARMRIRDALRMRTIVRKDKRYRLGYLFCRLRKQVIEQRKLASGAEGNRFNTWRLHDVYTMMRMYERVARYDVDIRDTINHIRRVYAERAVIDKLY